MSLDQRTRDDERRLHWEAGARHGLAIFFSASETKDATRRLSHSDNEREKLKKGFQI